MMELTSLTSYLTAPVQIVILVIVITIIRKLLRRKPAPAQVEEQPVPPMEKRDFTIEELQPYNGKENDRILLALNGKVYDVTSARSFYGPDGPYSVFAGHDASRGLATFAIDASTIKEEYDDLSDLNCMQMESMLEWEMQFKEKYECIGKLLKPGEKHTNYKAEESEDERNDGDKKSN